VVATAIFESKTNKYTGMFKGAENVLIRLSEADLYHNDNSVSANPSVAFKFLRNKIHSANQFGMVSFEGTSSWNFFAQDFLSVLPIH